jgi:AraC-like DNA-binding protein
MIRIIAFIERVDYMFRKTGLNRQEDTEKEKRNELVKHIERLAPEDGVHSTSIPSMHFIRSSTKSEPVHLIHEPALCIVAQGSKLVFLGQENYRYDSFHYLVVSIDLPISGQILEATSETPYLCLQLNFDSKLVFDILRESDSMSLENKKESVRGLFVSKTNIDLLDAVVRLVRLLDTPQDISVLAPLTIREILYRIMQDTKGDSIKQISIAGSHAQRISTVIQKIKSDFVQPISIKELAQSVNMSSSSLHHHFKQLTGMSPLQFQKQLRLQEAHRLMLSELADAANAGFQVGYESPSHFSREYSRLFGLPPLSHIKRLKES